MPKDNNLRTTITIDKALKEAIGALATKESRDFSAELSVLLREALSARKDASRAAASAN